MRTAANITGLQANCVDTSVPWQSEFAETEPTFRFPRIVFPDDQDGSFFSGGNSLIFRQTPKPSIILKGRRWEDDGPGKE